MQNSAVGQASASANTNRRLLQTADTAKPLLPAEWADDEAAADVDAQNPAVGAASASANTN